MKNVLMITIIALLSIGMVFTYSYAKSNVATNNVASMNGGTPLSMPGSSSDNNSSSSNSIPMVVMR